MSFCWKRENCNFKHNFIFIKIGSSHFIYCFFDLGPVRNPLTLSEEEWNTTFRTNVTGSWLVSKYVGLQMVANNQGGSIINISSTAGLTRGHLPGALAYASSKSALNTMTKVTKKPTPIKCPY